MSCRRCRRPRWGRRRAQARTTRRRSMSRSRRPACCPPQCAPRRRRRSRPRPRRSTRAAWCRRQRSRAAPPSPRSRAPARPRPSTARAKRRGGSAPPARRAATRPSRRAAPSPFAGPGRAAASHSPRLEGHCLPVPKHVLRALPGRRASTCCRASSRQHTFQADVGWPVHIQQYRRAEAKVCHISAPLRECSGVESVSMYSSTCPASSRFTQPLSRNLRCC